MESVREIENRAFDVSDVFEEEAIELKTTKKKGDVRKENVPLLFTVRPTTSTAFSSI